MTPEAIANLAHLRRARDLIDRDYALPLDVPTMAARALMSPAQREVNVNPRTARVTAATVLLTVAVAGCASSETTKQPTSASGALKAQIDEAWGQFHDQYPDVPRPSVSVIGVMGQDDQMSQLVECLHEAGFTTVTGDASGYTWGDIPSEQQQPFALAQYTCSARYPLDPKYSAPLSDKQLTLLYNYYVGDLTQCVEKQGITVSAAPSLQKFIESGGGAWSPFDDVAQLGNAKVSEVDRLCPQTPYSLYK